MRVKSGVARHKKKKRLAKDVKGYYGNEKNLRQAIERRLRAGQNAYDHRRLKKRQFRSLWITRLNAALESHDLSYSRFIGGLRKADVALNRKTLSELAIHDPEAFKAFVDIAKANN